MPRPSASPALRVLRTLRTGSRMTLRRHKDFLALAALCRKSPATADYSPSGHSALPWLAANEGSHVKQGDPIVNVVDNDPDLLERLKLKEKAQALNLEAAKQAAKTALVNVNRQRALFKLGASSKRKLEQAKLEHMGYLQKVASAEVDLTRIQVTLARQKNQLIHAPISGTILRRLAGQSSVMVSAGDILATLVPDTHSRAAEVYIDGNDISLIRLGDQVRLQFEGWPALQISGWPAVAIGSFPARVISIDAASLGRGEFRILVAPNKRSNWPESRYLRQGVRVNAWILLNKVTLGYELWRRFNGFPPLREKIKLKQNKTSAK